ncbi:MAG: long-chain fatty acid--CoA ligase [Spirochaetota bacterium]
MQQYYEEKTIPAIFRNKAQEFPERIFTRHREDHGWVNTTYEEALTQVNAIASWLINYGIKENDNIAIFSENRPEWVFSDLAMLSTGTADVTIYATNSSPEAAYIINDSDSRLCFCSGEEQVNRLIAAKDEMPGLEKIIVFDNIKHQDPLVITLSEVIKQGKENLKPDEIDKRINQINPEDTMTLMYTSGTTGNPKGVMLTHNNMVKQADQFLTHHPFDFDVTALSILPLSHSLERTIGYHCVLFKAQTVAYSRGPDFLLEDLTDIRPTAFLVVPRILEKIYEKIMSQVEKAPASKKKIFGWALKTGKKATPYIITNKTLPLMLKLRYNLADKIIFSKLRQAIGMDKLVVVGMGGAPLSPEINQFFQFMGIEVHAGFGLTETSPVTHVHTYKEQMPIKLASVGPPLPDTECMIAEDGEILIKGPQVMKGYYKNPEATAEVFTEDGWFKTGDIGHMDEDGYLFITDRKKDIIITAGGKNIAPQFIESMVLLNPFIEQAIIIGDRRKFISALIVPSFENLESWVEKNNIDNLSPEDLIKNEKIIAHFNEIISGINSKLGQVEQIKKFTLMDKPFSMEKGEITPTLKIKRKQIQENYKNIIESMYKN